ncbi:MAG: hypothetical protein IAE83_17275 [Anaerolinea sp.]|nr:hypothetical protein [Anaerolinea sp.]
MPKKHRQKNSAPSVRQVEYHPPSPETITQFARKVCLGLGETVDKRYNTAETPHGLAAFLRVVASICAGKLNKPNQPVLDSDDKP